MNLPDELQAELLTQFGRRYSAGDTLYEKDEIADHVFLIHEGRLRCVKRFGASERSMCVFHPGDVFGEDALLGEGIRRTGAGLALTDMEVIQLDRMAFGDLLQQQPAFASGVIVQLVGRLRDAGEQLENMHLTDHASRVVNTLLRLSARLPPEGPWRLYVTPLELSSRVGLDVDAVKRAINRLREGGYVVIDDEQIVLPDLDGLRQLRQLLDAKEAVRDGVL